MSYRLKPGLPLDHEVRRVARGQLDRLTELAALSGDASREVHETRKSVKRLRSLLRLVRAGLAREDWRRLNGELRAVARGLAAARDRTVLEATLLVLASNGPAALGADIGKVRAALMRPVSDAGGSACEDAGEPVCEARAALGAIAEAIDRIVLEGWDGRILERGLARCHRAARRALVAAREEPSDETFHQLRKEAQVHWRQMQLLARAWPEALRARIAAARQLSQLLGEEHDLAALAQRAGAIERARSANAAIARVVAAARARQQALRGTALELADRLFQPRPGRFAAEIGAYWRMAGECKTDAAPPEPRAAAAAPAAKRRKSAAALAKMKRPPREGTGARRRNALKKAARRN